ncbi:MAG TPA: SRPBCC family protein [Trichormus sp.]|jgi:uncharacterized membrane protein
MRLSQRAVTTFGALALFFCVGLMAPVSARAMDKNQCTLGTAAVEEQIGEHKYQVSRMLIEAPLTQVQAVLTDYQQTTHMFPNVKKCHVVEDVGGLKKIAFTACAPANLWTFDYVLEVKETPGYIEWRRLSGAFKKNEGFWKLEPMDDGRATLVTYAKFIDGGLLLPQPLVTRELRTSMPEVMANLKSSVELRSKVARADSHLH